MRPHWAHRRRWNHQPSLARQVAQPGPLGGTEGSIGASSVMMATLCRPARPPAAARGHPPACAGRARLDVLALTSKVVMRVTSTLPAQTGTGSLDGLRAIERRVLWLSTAIIDHANRIRPTPTGLKVGGHQASSASMVSIMTELW